MPFTSETDARLIQRILRESLGSYTLWLQRNWRKTRRVRKCYQNNWI